MIQDQFHIFIISIDSSFFGCDNLDIYESPWYLKDRNERIKLKRESENENFKKKYRTLDPNSQLLYNEAIFCFIDECYVSTSLTIYLAIEQYLLWRNQNLKGELLATVYPISEEILKEALENKLIDDKLSEDIKLYRDGCRHEIMHNKRFNLLHTVGLPKNKNKSHFGREGIPAVYLSPLACAARGLKLFYNVLAFVQK